jgi:FtsH-binding integral membrane protein
MNILSFISLPSAYAQAANNLIPCPDGTMADPSIGCVTTPASVANSNTPVSEIILNIASFALTAVIVVATATLIYGGIRYATALGEEEKLQKSKRLLFWGIVGLAVALTARLLIGGVAGLIT